MTVTALTLDATRPVCSECGQAATDGLIRGTHLWAWCDQHEATILDRIDAPSGLFRCRHPRLSPRQINRLLLAASYEALLAVNWYRDQLPGLYSGILGAHTPPHAILSILTSLVACAVLARQIIE